MDTNAACSGFLLFMLPALMSLKWRCIILALVATLAWACKGLFEGLLVGLSPQVVALQFGKSLLFGSFFALLAAMLVPPVLERLRSHDLIDREEI